MTKQNRVSPLTYSTPKRNRVSPVTYSIFGLCDEVAAEQFIKEGKIKVKIPPDQIPETVLYNQDGKKALFAVIVPGEHVEAFNKLCDQLRA